MEIWTKKQNHHYKLGKGFSRHTRRFFSHDTKIRRHKTSLICLAPVCRKPFLKSWKTYLNLPKNSLHWSKSYQTNCLERAPLLSVLCFILACLSVSQLAVAAPFASSTADQHHAVLSSAARGRGEWMNSAGRSPSLEGFQLRPG